MSNRQHTTPLVIRDGEVTRLHRIPFSERAYDESWLQELLFKHPSLLPIGQIEPVFADSVPIVRELPTAAGPLDILYMNARGFMTIVETKLWRNPDARRSVVAQIIDYAKDMASWSYEDLLNAMRKTGLRSGGDPLVEMMQTMEGEDFDEQEFIDQVTKGLQRSRFLLLIVGDGIQEGVEQMAAFLQQTPQLGYSLGLVEIGLYREHPKTNDPLFIQPRILARTREITRAVVELKVPVSPADIRITLPPEDTGQSRTRKPITEEEFYEELKKSAGPEVIEFARWVLDNAEDHGLKVD